MRLDHYLGDLLYRYECVTLPGFGALLSRRMAARIHENSNTFYPPKKALSFNAQLAGNDGLLANYIAGVEGVDFDTATDRIKSYNRYLETTMQEQGYVSIDKIGRFSRNEEGQLQFQPFYLVNFLPEAFGLGSFERNQVQEKFIPESIPVPQVAVAPVVPVKLQQEQEKQVRKIPYLRYAAVGLVAIALAGAAGLNIHKGNVEEHNLVAKENAQKVIQTEIQEATFAIPMDMDTIEIPVIHQSGSFHIIAGAFRIEENADRKVAQLQAKGYNARRIGTSKYGLHQVAFESYNTRQEALKALRHIKKYESAAAWLYIKTL